MITENVEIDFSVQLEVVNGTDLSSSCDTDTDPYYYIPPSSFDTFCPSNSSDYKWKLCNIPEKYGNDSLEMTYRSPYFSKIESEEEIDVVIAWLSFLHGNILSIITFAPFLLPDSWIIYYSYFYFDASNYAVISTSVPMTLVMERLDCNPSLHLTQCALSELLSWVSELLSATCMADFDSRRFLLVHRSKYIQRLEEDHRLGINIRRELSLQDIIIMKMIRK